MELLYLGGAGLILYGLKDVNAKHHRVRVEESMEFPDHAINIKTLGQQLGPHINGSTGAPVHLAGTYAGDGASQVNKGLNEKMRGGLVGIGKHHSFTLEDRVKNFYGKHKHARKLATAKAHHVVAQTMGTSVRVGNDHKPTGTSYIGTGGVQHGVSDVQMSFIRQYHDEKYEPYAMMYENEFTAKDPESNYVAYVRGDISKKPPVYSGTPSQQWPVGRIGL